MILARTRLIRAHTTTARSTTNTTNSYTKFLATFVNNSVVQNNNCNTDNRTMHFSTSSRTVAFAAALATTTTTTSPSLQFAHAFAPILSTTSTMPSSLSSSSLFSTTNTNTDDDAVTTTQYADVARYCTDHPSNNIPPHIAALVGRGLHTKENHPIGIVRAKIQEYFHSLEDGDKYQIFDAEDPIVTTTQCFDDLRIDRDHPGRSPSDTYYLTDEKVLRTHTSAHQSQHLREGYTQFLCAGDVYRRDEIDASHYPAFHQLEGVKLFPSASMTAAHGFTDADWLASPECHVIAEDLKATLEGLMDYLFGPVEKKWSEDYFPFTEPSFECEILYQGEWLEVLGCGVIHTEVLERAGIDAPGTDIRGWAFGLGLERLAMILFGIPDIRLFWTDDVRFTNQFEAGTISTFKPYSKYPPCYKDIAFWIPDGFVENDFFELARGIGGDLIETIKCTDTFTNPKTEKTSQCYRITYRSMDRSLTDDEINTLQNNLRDASETSLQLEVR